ncbi:glycosyltransferase [Spirosoma rhododendri]|uniref:Glycosyltransferase n=1 Tax=Spirosoma rhododendri TaxID=2728024 RepID=A0A7L5DSV4_9BACT|nr:glycosyltransferase [Spirosoma rhododendri]QJD79047.1 glycosyltransferase [Spirosoma rhododendri]
MITPVRPTISIALCTYNGEAYLATQWQSLVEQQLLPDELVVCDDRSSDGTVALLERLAAKAPFPVRILVNENRLGFNKNFERVLTECIGDLVFICDQDDAWFPEKIRVMTDFMTSHPTTQVAFCDAWVTDEQLQERQSRFWSWVRFDEPTRTRWQSGEMMDVMLDGNRVMGCASVIRRSLLTHILPIPGNLPGYIYDGWIGLVAAAYDSIQFVDEPLQLYRTHEKQQVGVGREEDVPDRVRLRDRFIRPRAIKLAPLREKQATLATFARLLSERAPVTTPGMQQLYRRLAHFTMRSCLPHDRMRRFQPVWLGLQQGDYQRYADVSANWYAPMLAALGDILE